MDKKIDAQLVSEYKSGNQMALAKLVKRWHKPFCNKAYWLVKDADLAKDIAQDCWKIIIDRIDTLKDDNSFGGWAMRIVYSKSLDEIRKNNRSRIKKEEYAKNHQEETVEVTNDLQLKKQLLECIRQLPQHQQMVIKLFYVEGYSLKDIGNILNISVGTAKSRLFHARETLKKKLNTRNHEK